MLILYKVKELHSVDIKKKLGDVYSSIGTKILDTPCPKCGVNIIDGICPNCVADTPQAAVDQNSKFKNYLFSPKEKIVSILGNDYLQNYLSGGSVSRGFSVVTDKRVYFRGKVFEAIGNKLRKTKVSVAVNVRDITGVCVTYISPIHFIISGAVCFLLGIILGVALAGILFGIGFIASVINFLLYFFKRQTMLKIQYAGGAIGFNIKWFPEAESLSYQKMLFLAKDRIFSDKE